MLHLDHKRAEKSNSVLNQKEGRPRTFDEQHRKDYRVPVLNLLFYGTEGRPPLGMQSSRLVEELICIMVSGSFMRKRTKISMSVPGDSKLWKSVVVDQAQGLERAMRFQN